MLAAIRIGEFSFCSSLPMQFERHRSDRAELPLRNKFGGVNVGHFVAWSARNPGHRVPRGNGAGDERWFGRSSCRCRVV